MPSSSVLRLIFPFEGQACEQAIDQTDSSGHKGGGLGEAIDLSDWITDRKDCKERRHIAMLQSTSQTDHLRPMLFQAALSALKDKRKVLFVTKQKMDFLPGPVHAMPSAKEVFCADDDVLARRLRFVYPRTYDELVRFVSGLASSGRGGGASGNESFFKSGFPGLVVVDGLEAFVTEAHQNGGEGDGNHALRRLVALLALLHELSLSVAKSQADTSQKSVATCTTASEAPFEILLGFSSSSPLEFSSSQLTRRLHIWVDEIWRLEKTKKETKEKVVEKGDGRKETGLRLVWTNEERSYHLDFMQLGKEYFPLRLSVQE